jgi:hypothetical protein
MENLNLEESSDQFLPNSGSEENFNCISNYSEEDFTARYGGVSHGSEEEWTSGLELHDDEPMLSSLGPDYDISSPIRCMLSSEKLQKNLSPMATP